MCDDSLICEPQESNKYDKYAVAIVFDDCILKKAAGHVPLYFRKLAFKFLQFQNYSIRVAVTGKRVNSSNKFRWIYSFQICSVSAPPRDAAIIYVTGNMRVVK